MDYHEVVDDAGSMVDPCAWFAYLVQAVAKKGRAFLLLIKLDTNAFLEVKDDQISEELPFLVSYFSTATKGHK